MERDVAEGQLPGEEGVEGGEVRKKLITKGVVVDETHEEDGGGLVGNGEIHEK